MQNKTNERFVNPYNFVPLEEKCERSKYEQGTLTGYLTCTLTTLTPLFIPNTSCDHALHREEEKDDNYVSYNFYSYEDLSGEGIRKDGFYSPVIPGSEIRGTIRSVFEAAFNGCLSQVNKDEPLHRRSMQPKKPALLRKTKQGWEMKECNRIILNTDPRNRKKESKYGKFIDVKTLAEGQVLYFTARYNKKRTTIINYSTNGTKNEKKNWNIGYVHVGEPADNKYHESLFVPKNSRWEEVDDGEIERLKKVLEMYKNNNKDNDTHSGYKEYTKQLYDILQKDEVEIEQEYYFLVYYSVVNEKKCFFTPAMLSQEVFQNTVGDLLRENGHYEPCESRHEVCPACALFGYISKHKGQSLASSVRFTDAVTTDKDNWYMEPVVLDELGEPKPGTVEFYTDKPEKLERQKRMSAKYWTYDYVILEEKEERKKLQTKGQKSSRQILALNAGDLQIRGRKFYWHHSNESLSNKLSDGNLSEMKQRIRPLKTGNKFTFSVYFEQITEVELARLCWALDFHNSDCAHKMGRGKPLGLGSVQIKVDELKLRKIDRNSGAWHLQDTPVEKYKINNNSTSMDNVLKIARFEHPLKDNISYPKVTGERQKEKPNDTASHQWFNQNSNNKKSFSKVLPTIDEELNEEDKQNKWLKVLGNKSN